MTDRLVSCAEIKKGMNANRKNFTYPSHHKIVISSYWLLGLIEGEGSFYIITKDFQLILDIGQSAVDSALMVVIQDFFNKLPVAERRKFV